MAPGHPVQHLQRTPQGDPRVVVVLRPLLAAAVRAVAVQKAVQAVGGLLRHPALHVLAVPGGEHRQQHVLGAPGGPVVHGLVPVSHPPEMLPEVGGHHPGIHLPENAPAQPRGRRLQLLPQQRPDEGQVGRRLAGEQVGYGPGGIGQGQGGRVPDVGVVGGELPAALLAHEPDPVDQVTKYPPLGFTQEPAPVLGALRQGQGAQGLLAGMAFLLVAGAVSRAGKGQIVAAGHHGPLPAQVFLSPADQRRANALRQALPDGPVARAGKFQVFKVIGQIVQILLYHSLSSHSSPPPV